jgi:mono/diheme cytochrome c family protein
MRDHNFMGTHGRERAGAVCANQQRGVFHLRTFRLIIAAGCLSFAFTAVSAQTQPSDTALTANPVFQKNCAKCHGKNAEGHFFGGPSLISEKTVAASADNLRSIIADGEGRMPKYAGRLTPEEIDMLVLEIKTRSKK